MWMRVSGMRKLQDLELGGEHCTSWDWRVTCYMHARCAPWKFRKESESDKKMQKCVSDRQKAVSEQHGPAQCHKCLMVQEQRRVGCTQVQARRLNATMEVCM